MTAAEDESGGITLDDIQALARSLAGKKSVAAVTAIFKNNGVERPKDAAPELYPAIKADFEKALA